MPIDRGAIDAQLKEIGEGERWWEQREFRDLPYVLNTDEHILGLTTGQLLGPRRPRLLPAARWLIVATNQRLLCLKQERFGRKQVDIRLEQISAIRHGSRIRAYQIALMASQRVYRIRIAKEDAFRFIGALLPLIPRSEVRSSDAGPGRASWLPGISPLAGLPGLSGLAKLPAPEAATRAELARVEATVERLEKEVERLQSQVEFLENLLQQRTDAVLSLPEPSPGR